MENIEIINMDGTAKKPERGIVLFDRISERVLKILDADFEILGSEEAARNLMIISKNKKMEEWNQRSLMADESGTPLSPEKMEELWSREFAEEIKAELKNLAEN